MRLCVISCDGGMVISGLGLSSRWSVLRFAIRLRFGAVGDIVMIIIINNYYIIHRYNIISALLFPHRRGSG